MTSPDNDDLIPMGAPTASFDVVMRGYDRNQVMDAIGRLEDDLRTLLTERDAAVKHAKEVRKKLEAAKVENDKLKDEVNSAGAPTYENMGGRIASMLRLAEEEAKEILNAANAEAEQIRSAATDERAAVDSELSSKRAEAEQYADDKRSQADEILAAAKAEAAEHLDTHRKQAEEHLANAKAEAADLLAASEAKRASADEDFEIALRHRRTAAHDAESERDRLTRAEAANRLQEAKEKAEQLAADAHAAATRTVDEANERSRAMIGAAEEEVNRLQQIRAGLATQIHAIGQLVSDVPQQLTIAPEALAADRDIDAPEAEHPTEPELTGTAEDQDAAGSLAQSLDPLPSDGQDPYPAADDVTGGSADDNTADDSDSAPINDEAPQETDADGAPSSEDTSDDAVADEPVAEADGGDAAVEDAADADESIDLRSADGTDTTDSSGGESAAGGAGSDRTQQVPVGQLPNPQNSLGAERTVQVSAIRPRRPKPGQRRM